MSEGRINLSKGRGQILIPADDYTVEYVEAMKYGDVLMSKPTGYQRNSQRFRKFWKMIDTAWKSLPEAYGNKSRDAFRKEVLVNSGYYHPYLLEVRGQELIYKEAISLQFDKMDELEFKLLYVKVHQYLWTSQNLPDTFFNQFL